VVKEWAKEERKEPSRREKTRPQGEGTSRSGDKRRKTIRPSDLRKKKTMSIMSTLEKKKGKRTSEKEGSRAGSAREEFRGGSYLKRNALGIGGRRFTNVGKRKGLS